MILFETLSQLYILLCLIVFGFISGFVFDVFNTITFLCNNNKVTKNILQCIATILCFFILFLVNLKTNYGQFRLYIFLVYFLFIFVERITIGKVIAKTNIWCYNTFKKFINIITKGKKWKKKTKENLK